MVVAKCEVAGRVSVAGRQRQTTLGLGRLFPFAPFLLSSGRPLLRDSSLKTCVFTVVPEVPSRGF